MNTFLATSAHELLHRTRRLILSGRAWAVAVALLVLLPLCAPAAAMAGTTGNWNLDDGAGHRLGVMLFERSDINKPSGLRLRLNAESDGLKLDHARPLVLSDGNEGSWSLTNRSKELIATAGGKIPVGSSQFDAGCLSPIPDDGMTMQISVPSSAGDLSFALSAGQVETLHSLALACAN
jgi:hypothetical protein